MRRWYVPFPSICVLAVGLALLLGCQRSQPADSPHGSLSQSKIVVPSDLQDTVDRLVRAAETFDIPHFLNAYAEDFLSGAGRTKASIREVFTRLRENNVKLEVEKTTIENIENEKASVRIQLRLRYMDHFRNLGEGEVVITDVLRHALRKEEAGWKIYTDERLFTYREGRFGAHAPNVQLTVPDLLPIDLEYVVTITVPQEENTEYQVIVGNYVEDSAILPPPDIVTPLPEDGVLHAHLLPNPQGLGEMVRITVIAANSEGQWIGATTISKFVPGVSRQKQEQEKELI